jgi:DNA modification methylase
MGHPFIGFEKEQSYYDAASIRIKKAQEQGKISGWFE